MFSIANVRQQLAVSAPLGAKFKYVSSQILGPDGERCKPSFEGQVLTVIGHKPRYVNNVVVRDEHGHQCLLPLYEVEKGLKVAPIVVPPLELSQLYIPSCNGHSHILSKVIDFHPVQWQMAESLLHRGGLPFRDPDGVIRCGLAIGLYVLLQPQPDRATLAGAKANIDQDAEFERKKDCLAESVQKMLAAGQVDGAKRIDSGTFTR